MNYITRVSMAVKKHFENRMVNFVLGKRLCGKCAKKEWKNEDEDQSFTILLGICEKCHRGGIVAYIEKGVS